MSGRPEVRELARRLRAAGYSAAASADHVVFGRSFGPAWLAVQQKPGADLFDLYEAADDPGPGLWPQNAPVSGTWRSARAVLEAMGATE